MSWLDNAKAELEKHSFALEIIQGIGALVKDALVKPGSDVNAVLKAIETAIDALVSGFDGKPVTREEGEKIIAALLSRREARNAAFDKALDDKFDGGGKP